MPDSHRFRTERKTITGDGDVGWGGDSGWEGEIADSEGVSIENGSVVPSRIAGPTDGLVTYYPFDDGTATDTVGGRDGTVHGATHLENGGPRGDGALDFNGASDYVGVPDYDVVDGASRATIALWVNLQSTGIASIIGQYDDDPTKWFVDNDVGGMRIRAGFYGSSASPQATGSTTLQTGTWYHVVVTLDGGTVRIYLDGSEDGSTQSSLSTIHSGPTTMRVGSWNDRRYMDGHLTGVRVYDRALTDTEVADLYDATR